MGFVKLVSDIFKYYGPRPHRWIEIPRWVRTRNVSTLSQRYPWWAFPTASSIADTLEPGAKVFEFGGGGSSLWLLDQGAKVSVVEHDPGWARALADVAGSRLELLLVEPNSYGSVKSADYSDLYFDSYSKAITDCALESLDLVIVDGRARVACGLEAMPYIKPGGMLLLDDSDRSRYTELCRALRGWHREDFRGLKIGCDVVVQTSVWVRPGP